MKCVPGRVRKARAKTRCVWKTERRPVLLKCWELGRALYEMHLMRLLGHSVSCILRPMDIIWLWYDQVYVLKRSLGLQCGKELILSMMWGRRWTSFFAMWVFLSQHNLLKRLFFPYCFSFLIGNQLIINMKVSGLSVNLYVYPYASKTTLSCLL